MFCKLVDLVRLLRLQGPCHHCASADERKLGMNTRGGYYNYSEELRELDMRAWGPVGSWSWNMGEDCSGMNLLQNCDWFDLEEGDP